MKRLHLLLVASAACAAACGPDARDNLVDAGGPGPDAPVVGPDAAPGPDSPIQDQSRVYAHSGKQLYRIDTTTLAPQLIGDVAFDDLSTKSLTDIAVDKNDKMIGITLDTIYAIDPATAAATKLQKMTGASGFTSLSYVPDPANPTGDDILVAANSAGDVYRIDPSTGMATQIGSYGKTGGMAIGSSGDIVGIRGVGIFATVFVGSPTTSTDYLARIDPTNGWAATLLPVDTGYQHIFGVGFWAGKIYGFVDNKTDKTGQILTIDQTTGAAAKVGDGAIEWYGAGVTTNAAIIQ